MAILRETLFETKDIVQIAINRIKEFEPSKGYYLAFSGGKDSVVIYALAKMAHVKYDAHYNLTTVDPPELIKFIKKEYAQVQIDKPKTSMWKLIIKKRMPPTRVVRYCCEYLKEYGGIDRLVLTGIRNKESFARSKRRMLEICLKNKRKTYLHPIIDWTTADVWEFIKQYNIKYCKLYDEGFKRLGCVMCPMQGKNGMLRDAERWPKTAQQYKKTFQKCIDKRIADGLDPLFKTGDHMYKWWIYKPNKLIKNQCVLFE